MNSLTKEDVRALIESGELEHCNEMDFSSYTHIEEDAAKCIAEEGGGRNLLLEYPTLYHFGRCSVLAGSVWRSLWHSF